MSVSLKAGGNYVVYTGKAQSASDAFASIVSYLDPASVVYYWNNYTGLHEQVVTTTVMVPYGCYWIEVTQDCTWTYGAEATAPSSVQLYARDVGNIVPYLGPAQPVEDGFASIVAYVTVYYCFNNMTKLWEFTPTMVPNGVYFVKVSQDCVWSFVAPEPPFTEITEIVAPSSARAGETVNIEVRVKNIAPYAIYITVTGRVNGLDLGFNNIYYSVPPGGIQSFYDAFIMPSRDVTVIAWSWYKIDGWPEEPDDEKTKDVNLAELATEVTQFEISDYVKV